MILVADSSPLISLAILELLDSLKIVFENLTVPKAVYDEVSKKEKPFSNELSEFLENKVLEVKNTVSVQFLRKQIGIGESEAIVLAIENNINFILIDDLKGRQVSESFGIQTIGTLGVLLKLQKLNLIVKLNLK